MDKKQVTFWTDSVILALTLQRSHQAEAQQESFSNPLLCFIRKMDKAEN